MASLARKDVYRETTSRLQGYFRDLLVVKSPSCMCVMRSRLFSSYTETFLSKGLRALMNNFVGGDEASLNKSRKLIAWADIVQAELF